MENTIDWDEVCRLCMGTTDKCNAWRCDVALEMYLDEEEPNENDKE